MNKLRIIVAVVALTFFSFKAGEMLSERRVYGHVSDCSHVNLDKVVKDIRKFYGHKGKFTHVYNHTSAYMGNVWKNCFKRKLYESE